MLRLACAAIVLIAMLAIAPVVLADTATPPAAQESNTLIIGIVALGALAAVIVLNRPRKGPR